MQALRQAGRPVPLIVLSSCSGGASGSHAMAAGLVGRGADRVIAMLAPVTDGYATVLARRLYQELAARPGQHGRAGAGPGPRTWPRKTAGTRRQGPGAAAGVRGGDAAGRRRATGRWSTRRPPAVPLTVATAPPGGRSVRELPVGALIGRRAQLRTAMGVLRRDPGGGAASSARPAGWC